jgi:steroid 5-alpha reductase family enzyme
MAKVTLIFAALLIVLGLAGFFGTGSAHPTALIPAWWGLAMGLFGFLAMSPSEARRKVFMHINAAIAVVGCVGALVVAVQGYGSAREAGMDPDYIALAAKLIMAALLLIYVLLCIQSFVDARRSRQE